MFALENQKPPLNPKSSQVSKPRFLTLEADVQHIIAYESRSRRKRKSDWTCSPGGTEVRYHLEAVKVTRPCGGGTTASTRFS
jgi:hypothetical protein